ncbi:SIR2 family protein [Mumia zhuanghuii]|uniref:DUF4020 domain-containing protein n=1 Tax=Mumia zhuanghuii TaxID=2585211 RepID=A0A5C4MYZ1_9ACTN|nr:SIR2 family protein [Mumia zhuanghuii]TNC51412.1 DUF4020 domain-containing protein [Mumia zhuanghuii]
MWIGDIDLPPAVLDAAEAGHLVLFVGAGASRSRPSFLPDFGELVREIGSLAGREPTDVEVKQPDVFLGQLEDGGVDVHQLVAAAIDQPGSRHNPLHTAIARLATAYGKPRIVTTNYDRHLSSAAAELSLDLEIYQAPALPIGDDFEGIVHLHGSLDQPSRRLVVTDSDFGRSYLREAWAARFLERMFSTSTVLFIGYSHGDVVMQYLARSLGPDGKRYIVTDQAPNVEWRRLGLTPISYPNDSGDHSALPAGVERWVELATMGQIEHRARIAGLVEAEPPTIPEEVSYLEAVLADPARISHFVEKAHFEEDARAQRWFAWLEGRAIFTSVFSQDTTDSNTSRALMSWITNEYLCNERRSGIAIRAFSERSWPHATWEAITHRLFSQGGEFPQWLSPWLQLTLQNAPHRRDNLLDMMLVDKDWSKNFDLALMLFEDRTRPLLRRAFDFGTPDGSPRFEIDLCGDEYWLTEAWTKIFVPVLAQHLGQLLGLITEQIAHVYRSQRALDPDGTFDPISFSRSAIEHHEQDLHRHPVDVLTDAARDCIEEAVSADPTVGQTFLSLWSRSPDTILRRLALHGWRVRTDVSSDEKLTWLQAQGWLWEVPLQHEVFQLLKEAFPLTSEPLARRFVDAAAAGPPAGEDVELAAYQSYNLLGWLAETSPGQSISKDAFNEIQAAHPEFRRRDHPDLTHFSSSGGVEDALPYTGSELHELISRDPADAVARLREFQNDSLTLTGPSWMGALESLRTCVREHPDDGTILAQVLQPEDSALRTALINGWDGAALDQAQAEQALEIIAGWGHDEVRQAACAMLSNGGAPEHPTPWHQLDAARELASTLWPTSSVDGSVVGGADILLEAINHSAGDLAEFWTKVVQWEWSENETTWDGIPQHLITQLDRLVSSTDRNGLLAQVFLASQLYFYFGADRAWCEAHLLPLLDWAKDEETAAAAWQGFLTWGRWNDGLLQAGLLDGFIATARHSDKLPERLRRQLASHLTSLAIYAQPIPATWLTRFVADSPEALRVEWAEEVRRALVELGEGEATEQWGRWIESYWSGRNRSVPRPFTPDEASVTAGWVLGLSGVRAQAIDLVLGSSAGVDMRGGFLSRLKDLDLATDARNWARLLTHLLKNTSSQSTGSHAWRLGRYLQEIVPQLRQGRPPPDLTKLIDEAMRLGITNAGEW